MKIKPLIISFEYFNSNSLLTVIEIIDTASINYPLNCLYSLGTS